MTFHYGIKINLIKIFNPGSLFVNPVAGEDVGGDVTHFQIFPEVCLGSPCIEAVVMAADDKLILPENFTERNMERGFSRASHIQPPVISGNYIPGKP